MKVLATDSPLSLPPPGTVQLWLLHEPHSLAASESALVESWLSVEERERWQRFRQGEDRNRFLLTRALLRGILARYTHGKPAQLQFGKDENGKPLLLEQGLPHATLNFNLSHTRGLCALAVSSGHPVGVDVENNTRKLAILPLAQRFFAREEIQYLQQLNPTELQSAFFRLWTLKEAYVKAVGVGLKLGLDTFAIAIESGAPQLARTSDRNAAEWTLHMHEIDGHYQLAVALPIPHAEFTMRTLV